MRVIEGDDARNMAHMIETCRELALLYGFEEVYIPSVWEQAPFVDKAGPEILGQMYTFPDKKGRPLVLIPEVTAIVQELWREKWSKQRRERRIFYVNRCYRYERPQAGRYREFTQFGVEFLGGTQPQDEDTIFNMVTVLQAQLPFETNYSNAVKRGLNYYVEDGFEVEAPSLGAQKQVLGGGRYEGGIGFAVGIDRLALALSENGLSV